MRSRELEDKPRRLVRLPLLAVSGLRLAHRALVHAGK
jgi:hypothetical protein